jgi:hypothetical protein
VTEPRPAGRSARLVGLVVLGIALAGWLGVYALLAQSRAQGGVHDLGFGLGLFAGLTVFLPLAAVGIFLLVRGGPDAADYAARRVVVRALAEAETAGWSDLWALMRQIQTGQGVMGREKVAQLLAEEADRRGFRGFADWGRGVLALARQDDGCPACGAVSDSSAMRAGICPNCHVQRLMSVTVSAGKKSHPR